MWRGKKYCMYQDMTKKKRLTGGSPITWTYASPQGTHCQVTQQAGPTEGALMGNSTVERGKNTLLPEEVHYVRSQACQVTGCSWGQEPAHSCVERWGPVLELSA
eukprot:1960356-Pyramimonas_sp.AAC.1